MKAFFRELLLTLLLSLVLFFAMRAVIQSYVVNGPSMEPTFHQGQRLLVNKLEYSFHDPERGSVIIFHPANPNEEVYIKRIIGMPGDTVEIKNGVVYVNGKPLNEPYAVTPSYTYALHTVPPGNYFVLGDNRNNSNDSHYGWLVPREDIVGRVWVSIWPPTRWGIVPIYPLQDQLSLDLKAGLALPGTAGTLVQ